MSVKRLNIVMVAHYYPPINSSGAKRFQFLSKYLAEMGADVTVITTKKRNSDGQFTETIPAGVALFELDSFGRVSQSIDDGKDFVPLYSDKPSVIRRIKDFTMWLLGQIPDPRLPFSLSMLYSCFNKELENRLKNCDVIIATSPPWSMLLAGLFLKMRYRKKLIMDYRDHFSYCHEMPGNFIAKKIEYVIDKFITKRADILVTISEPMFSYYKEFNSNCFVITNGYDDEAMNSSAIAQNDTDGNASDKVRIRYMGIVSDGRIPRNIISALKRLQDFDERKANRIVFEFYGNAGLLKEFLTSNFPSLIDNFVFHDFVSYKDSLSLMKASDYLLFSETSSRENLSTQGILTTKLFEYLGSGRPVLADISPETLAGGLIKESSLGNTVSVVPDDFFNLLSSDSFYIRRESSISDVALRYTRRNQAVVYKELIEKVVS